MKKTKDDLIINVSNEFSSNPEVVLVFTYNRNAVSHKEISPKKNTSIKNGSTKKSIYVFSRENFFYKEIVDFFHDYFYCSKSGEIFSIYKQGRYRQIVYLGTGQNSKEKNISPESRLEEIRISLGQLRKKLLLSKSIEVDLSEIKNMSELLGVKVPLLIETICDGLLLGNYRFKKYTSNSIEIPSCTITFICPDFLDVVQKIKTERLFVCKAALLARDFINEPPNILGVNAFVEESKKLAKKQGITFEVLSKKQLKQKQMNGILAVNAGSEEEAKLIFLDYAPAKASKKIPHVLIVGKGVLFDSGGLSLKPSKNMEEMKMDMSGAAVALASILAIADLKLPLRWTVALPLTDNMPSSKAIKVGSVVTMHNGKTVEILNTDAEGRLILADTLSYGIEKYKPDCVIDIATLTGAIAVALGHEYAGLFCNDPQLTETLLKSGQISGEKLWNMPLDDNYKKSLESNIADLKNIGSPFAGASTAAKFLENFTHQTKWAHIDIAGVMSQSSRSGYRSEGGRGVGVRLLCEFAKQYLKEQT